MNVKSQSELDIGGCETCSVIYGREIFPEDDLGLELTSRTLDLDLG